MMLAVKCMGQNYRRQSIQPAQRARRPPTHVTVDNARSPIKQYTMTSARQVCSSPAHLQAASTPSSAVLANLAPLTGVYSDVTMHGLMA